MKKSFIHQQKEISFVKTTFTQYLKDKLDRLNEDFDIEDAEEIQ